MFSMCTRYKCLSVSKGRNGYIEGRVWTETRSDPNKANSESWSSMFSICGTQYELQRLGQPSPIPFLASWAGSVNCLEFSSADILWSGISDFLGSLVQQPRVHSWGGASLRESDAAFRYAGKFP